MTTFTAFAAITAHRPTHGRPVVPRQDDSGAGMPLRCAAESAIPCAMSNALPAPPADLDAALALLAAERVAHAAERDRLVATNTHLAARDRQLETTTADLASANVRVATLESANARLEAILAEIRRAHFGRKSERISDDQLALALEGLETAAAKIEAEVAQSQLRGAGTKPKAERVRRQRQTNDGSLDHLTHEEIVIEPDGGTTCPCCQGALHRIGEDSAKRLDKVPAKVRVIVEIRPKYACRTCEKTGADEVAGIIQAPAPAHLIEGGLPTEALVADVVVSKHADHCPLYRQSQIFARHGVRIDRSTLSSWVGAAAAELQPLHDHLLSLLKASPKLFCDETRCPVPDPGRGKTKTGFLWAIARDDRPAVEDGFA